MKKLVIGSAMNFINKNCDFDDEKLAEIKYGLEGLYLTVSKLVIIFSLAYILNIFNEMIIFLLIYNISRTFGFGIHATKSWICLLSSTFTFILSPLLCKYLIMHTYLKVIIGIILIYLFYKNAPADTHKRPIINPKRRMFFKYTSTILAIIFVFLSITLNNNFLANCFLISLIVECIMISPTVYKLFGLPYNNYLKYLNESI